LLPADGGARCDDCGTRYAVHDGLLDLCPDLPQSTDLGQRFMESRRVSSIYERLFRPAMTALAGSPGYEDEERWLRQWFQPADGPLLDLACGTGRYARMLADWFGVPVVGADLSPSMLRQAVAHPTPRVTLVRASGQALPFGDGTLGGVNCFGALHLFPDPAAAIEEVGRVLKPGGCFTCLTCWQAPRRRIQQRMASRLSRICFIPRDTIELALNRGGMELTVFDDRGLMAAFAARRKAQAPGSIRVAGYSVSIE